MAFSFSKTPADVAGLDIDGTYLAAAVVDHGSIGRVASIDLEPGVAVDGEVREPEALSAALRDMFTRFKLPKQVRLGVANQQIVVRQLELPVIADPAERDAAIRFQAADAIAMPLEDVILDYQVIGASESPDGGPRERLLVVAARGTMIGQLVTAVKGAGLKPQGIDLSAFALVRMLGDDSPAAMDPEQPARVICHLGGVTNLAIAVGSMCVFTRPLQTAWDSDDDAAVASLAEEIRLSIDFHMAQPGARPIASAVLAGPGASDPRVAEALAARTRLDVSIGEPLGSLGTHTIPSQDDPYRYTVAAGLAMGEAA